MGQVALHHKVVVRQGKHHKEVAHLQMCKQCGQQIYYADLGESQQKALTRFTVQSISATLVSAVNKNTTTKACTSV